MHEALEQTVVLSGRGANVSCDEDGDDKSIDSNNTGHDDGNERLKVPLSGACSRANSARGKDTFMIRSGLNVPTPEIPMPDLAVPYAAPMPEIQSARRRNMTRSGCGDTSKDHLNKTWWSVG